jgi:hypothetical protein
MLPDLQQPARDANACFAENGSWQADLLPSFDGMRTDLALNREAPRYFAVQR